MLLPSGQKGAGTHKNVRQHYSGACVAIGWVLLGDLSWVVSDNCSTGSSLRQWVLCMQYSATLLEAENYVLQAVVAYVHNGAQNARRHIENQFSMYSGLLVR
jgi:hypothetical protein